jgi:hypothetical protein
MSERVKRFKRRQIIKRRLETIPAKPYLVDIETMKKILSEPADIERVENSSRNLCEILALDCGAIKVSDSEVEEFIDQFNSKEVAINAIIEPVFLSLIDGTMRAFKIGTKQGLTASRIYQQCRSFSYDDNKYVDSTVDRFTEHINEINSSREFGSKSGYSGGKFSRENEDELIMRDQSKMDAYKGSYFGGHDTAEDEYSPGETVYKDNKTAFAHEGMDSENKERHHQSAETDHIIPCTVLCNELKENKALNPQDIKEILNDDTNLAVTSHDINQNKGGKKNEDFIEIVKEDLTPEQIKTMTIKSQKARAAIDSNTNRKVVNNIGLDTKVQTRLAQGASEAAGHRAIGDAIIFFLKPLYFELCDCMRNGIENGVNANSFRESLNRRLGRMKSYIEKNIKSIISGSALNFIKSFFSMLIEGILTCFVGIFKHIVRAVSEGLRILMQIIPILKDKTKSAVEKGDAILKLIALASIALAGIGIESLLNSMGLGEPWSIILASILSTVITALVLYSLDKMDLFNQKRDVKRLRIREALSLINQETNERLQDLLCPGNVFVDLKGT